MGVTWLIVSPLPDGELLLFGLALGACALLHACCAPVGGDRSLLKTRIE